MDMDVEFLLIVTTGLAGPVLGMVALRKTPLYWLPGGIMVALGVAAVAGGQSMDTHGEAGVINALAAGVLAIAGFFAMGYGALCIAVGRWLHRKARKASTNPRDVQVSPPYPPDLRSPDEL